MELDVEVRKIIDTISNKDKVNGQCDGFAKKLEQNNIEYDIIRIDSGYGIYSDKAGEVIGVSFHYGIKVDDMIYDNMTSSGMSLESWLDDLGLTSQPKQIIDWSIVKEIFSS